MKTPEPLSKKNKFFIKGKMHTKNSKDKVYGYPTLVVETIKRNHSLGGRSKSILLSEWSLWGGGLTPVFLQLLGLLNTLYHSSRS